MKKFMKKLAKKTEGFTLVELIVVIAILGILAGVAVPAYSGYLTKAKEAADMTKLDAVLTAAQATKAKEGSLTKIVVTESDKTVKVALKADFSDLADIATNSDFNLYYGGTATTTAPTITLDTGATATWVGGTWTISGT